MPLHGLVSLGDDQEEAKSKLLLAYPDYRIYAFDSPALNNLTSFSAPDDDYKYMWFLCTRTVSGYSDNVITELYVYDRNLPGFSTDGGSKPENTVEPSSPSQVSIYDHLNYDEIYLLDYFWAEGAESASFKWLDHAGEKNIAGIDAVFGRWHLTVWFNNLDFIDFCDSSAGQLITVTADDISEQYQLRVEGDETPLIINDTQYHVSSGVIDYLPALVERVKSVKPNGTYQFDTYSWSSVVSGKEYLIW